MASIASDWLMEIFASDSEWATGFEDECWWSREALPTLNAWSEDAEPWRLVQRSVEKDDPEPKAISCYGLYVPELDGETWIRFVDGRPVSSITTRFLKWNCQKLQALGKKVLLLIWNNASWYVSKEARRWLGIHNRRVKKSGSEAGVRIVSCLLPKQSPWLNAIEPKWVHAKRKVVEPEGLIGGPLIIVSGVAVLLGVIEADSVWHAIAIIPEFLWELLLGIWPIVRGFNPSAIARLEHASR